MKLSRVLGSYGVFSHCEEKLGAVTQDARRASLKFDYEDVTEECFLRNFSSLSQQATFICAVQILLVLPIVRIIRPYIVIVRHYLLLFGRLRIYSCRSIRCSIDIVGKYY